MTPTSLAVLGAACLLLAGCAPGEPINGCLIAVANRREVLRAQAYLHPAIPSRLLLIRSVSGRIGHAALVCRLSPEGLIIYDDQFGSRLLRGHLAGVPGTDFPPALEIARAAFPGWPVGRAWYTEATPSVDTAP